jgi:DNA-dependent protein kinase catalytic subunit
VDSGERLIKTILPRLKQLFVNNKNDYSRALFYELMVFLYDQFEQLRNEVKSGLIRGLSDKSKVIRDKLISFWSDPARLSLDAVERIKQVMNDLHVKEEEGIWLNNAVFLLMQISTQSSDYERKIFDQPL